MKRWLLIALIGLLLSGCALRQRQWHDVPTPIVKESLPQAPAWNGVAIVVEDGRREPTGPVGVRWVDAGLTWSTYSNTLVQYTRTALFDTLGPTRADTTLELRVHIMEHIVRFKAPNWVGTTSLVAFVFVHGQQTSQRWAAQGQDSRWNWSGLDTAQAASQAAYENAVKDLVRQIAMTRPPA